MNPVASEFTNVSPPARSSGVGPAKTYGLDLDGHRAMLRTSLDRELDYRHEAAWQQRAAETAVSGVIVPRIHADLSNGRVLVQDWEAGATLAEAACIRLA